MKKNRLSVTYPQLANEWHPVLNEGLTPDEVTYGSKKVVWWQCEKGHEWETSIYQRVKGTGCPICANRKVLAGYNDIGTTHPEVAKEWHPTLNEGLMAEQFSKGSQKRVWWKCSDPDCGHSWSARINKRTYDGNGCPLCWYKRCSRQNRQPDEEVLLGRKCPSLAKEWHPTKNGDLTPFDVSYGCNKKAWWKGMCGHEWEASILNRVNGARCPYCFGKKIQKGFNDFESFYPELAKEWHPTLNGALKPDQISKFSGIDYWWQCEKGHSWNTSASQRAKGRTCPYCSQRKVIVGETDLASKHPEVARLWHPAKNGALSPQQVSAISYKTVWWLGDCGHEWQDSISRFIQRKHKCPYCSKRKVLKGENDLATTHPHLKEMWHPTKNKDFQLSEVTSISHVKVFWRCEHGHEWEKRVWQQAKQKTPCLICKDLKKN